MTPAEIELMQESFQQVSEGRDDVAAEFYRRLFERLPDVKGMFGTEPSEQQAKFLATLAEIVAALGEFDDVALQSRELGVRHRAYGVRAPHYPVVGEVLIETLAHALGERFTPAHDAAWRRGYDLVAELMQEGASRRPEPPRISNRLH